MPAHHTLEAYLDAYIETAGIGDAGKSSLFRSAVGRTGTLTEKPMNRIVAGAIIKFGGARAFVHGDGGVFIDRDPFVQDVVTQARLIVRDSKPDTGPSGRAE